MAQNCKDWVHLIEAEDEEVDKEIRAWYDALSSAKRKELLGLDISYYESDYDNTDHTRDLIHNMTMDWIEEHGGDPHWWQYIRLVPPQKNKQNPLDGGK